MEKTDSSNEKQPELTIKSVIFAIFFTVTVILALYFFYKYIVYFFIVIFILFSGYSFYVCGTTVVSHIVPASLLVHKYRLIIKSVRYVSIRYVFIPVLFLSIALPILWFCIRHSSPNAWILQDMLCVCFCLVQLTILRLPSFKICMMLLFALFVYDIFFVFVTPYFTESGEYLFCSIKMKIISLLLIFIQFSRRLYHGVRSNRRNESTKLTNRLSLWR